MPVNTAVLIVHCDCLYCNEQHVRNYYDGFAKNMASKFLDVPQTKS